MRQCADTFSNSILSNISLTVNGVFIVTLNTTAHYYFCYTYMTYNTTTVCSYCALNTTLPLFTELYNLKIKKVKRYKCKYKRMGASLKYSKYTGVTLTLENKKKLRIYNIIPIKFT